MAVTIRADVPGRLRSEAGQVAMLHVTAADPGRATEAVRAALPEISRLAPGRCAGCPDGTVPSP